MRHEGDSPQFCFTMPPGVMRFTAAFTWDTPNQMVLAFGAPGYEKDASKVHADPPGQPPAVLMPPLRVEVVEPEPGAWAASAMPWAIGGAARWQLALAWETAEPLDAEDVALDDGACFES